MQFIQFPLFRQRIQKKRTVKEQFIQFPLLKNSEKTVKEGI